MIKNYKSCRLKADSYGKITILKNNQPDAVLFSIAEYERLSLFIEFIEKELQPFIKASYKIKDTSYLIGQSFGGLLATEILLKKPYLFTNYIIVSPSLWWDDESLLKAAPALLTGQTDSKKWVYISVGVEGKEMEESAAGLVKALQNSGKKNMKVDFVPLPKENHATILHNSVYEALKISYPYKE